MTHPIGAFIVIDHELNNRIEAAVKLGIPTAQILAPPQTERSSEKISELKSIFKNAGIKITVVFCGFTGESYADIPTVKQTVGLVPLKTRAERLAEAKSISDFTKQLGVEATALHLGFIPEKAHGLDFDQLVSMTQELCDYCKSNGQRLHLETGQETADGLLQFIHAVNRDNLAVNFDPANMILYGSGEPIEALEKVGKYVKSAHCKDALWSEKPGITWGQEMPLGEGDVGMENFIKTLKEIGYEGPLTIEREISGEQQIKDIEKAVQLLNSFKKKFWNE